MPSPHQPYDQARAVEALTARLHRLDLPPVRFMEVCGTHTMAMARYAIRSLMPAAITLTSGPGCPVCVTATAEIDTFVDACRLPKSIVATFGDLVRVPGSDSSLEQEMGRGADVRVVYSPLDAVALARDHHDREVIFLGVGFETTAPTVAAAILAAEAEGLANFSVLSAHKLMPPALDALVADPEIEIHGLLCPGHVSVMIGAAAYRPLAANYAIPCVVAGFEPDDILEGIVLLAKQVAGRRAEVEIAYRRAVGWEGNRKALAIMDQVFAPTGAQWRGLGSIADSGLAIRPAFQAFDARHRFGLVDRPAREPAGCACGEVLKGLVRPAQCRLFGRACHPGRPVGPCMVSSEGACAAAYRYERPGQSCAGPGASPASSP